MRVYQQSATETALGVEPLGSYDVVLPYVVKCDECQAEIRRCATVGESARGGYCKSCGDALDARYPERVANRSAAVRDC